MSTYSSASELYSQSGVDTEAALKSLPAIPISLHCWQGDDVGGFEKEGSVLSGGGIQATGNYPGKARTLAELRGDLDRALSLIPGRHRLNLHACYADLGGKKLDRNAYTAAEFESSKDEGVRKFWIEHGVACREIAADAGRQIGLPVITNFWIPDGSKDLPVDRKGPRQRLEQSLDAIFSKKFDPALTRDAVECKLFGIGSEAYVVGSHEFYMGYAVTRQKLLCLDAGHFHPTESLADKISSVLQFVPEILLHVSRGVRWDSDHVVLLDDPTKAIAEEIVRGGFIGRTHFGLDYFDASINRVAAWVIGTRNALKALLLALLEPTEKLRELEDAGDFTSRLALLEELKTLPAGAVWDEYCRRQDVPVGTAWLAEVKSYEKNILSKRA